MAGYGWFMKCLICGRTSPIEAKMDQFPLNERVRKMLEREFGIGNPGALDNGVCRECLVLPGKVSLERRPVVHK